MNVHVHDAAGLEWLGSDVHDGLLEALSVSSTGS